MADATYQTPNYEEQGGKVWHIGDTLEIGSGAKIVPDGGSQAADPGAITDNTGGTASGTFAAITAGATYAQADLVAVKNALAEIAAQLNALRTALINAGIFA
jgi:hypothetical protein